MSAWRPARPADAGDIGRLSRALISAFPERDAVFAERIQLCPEGCHVLVEGADVLGYLVSHPWRRFDPPKLDALVGALPADADCWLVHDVAIEPRARGGGETLRILSQVGDLARDRGFCTLALVAVGEAPSYWRRQGFEPAASAQLAAYGDGAVYMERPL